MLTAPSVVGDGRAGPSGRRQLDRPVVEVPLLKFRLAPLLKFRRATRWAPVYLVPPLCPIRIPPLLIPARNGRGEQEVALRRLIPRRPSVLGVSRAPLPFDDPVRRWRRRDGRAMRPFCARRQLPPGPTEEFICITAPDIDNAWRYPLRGCLAYEELYPTGNPARPFLRQISNAGDLRGLPKEHVITREETSDHMAVALAAAGAIRVAPHEFRLMNGRGESACPAEGRNFEVGELRPRFPGTCIYSIAFLPMRRECRIGVEFPKVGGRAGAVREEVPTHVDMKTSPRDATVRDASVALPLTKADDTRDDFPALPRNGESEGDCGALSSLRGGYKGQCKGSILRA